MYVHHAFDNERATILIDRPDKRNALDGEGWLALRQSLEMFAAALSARVLTLRSTGSVFCGGADVHWLAQAPEEELRLVGEVVELLGHLPIPVICRVQGATYGGGVGLAAAADFVVASASATFTLSEARLGLAPALISPAVIARVGAHRFRRLAMLAQPLNAADAQTIGLVDVVATPEELDTAVETVAADLLRGAPGSHRAIKRIPDHGARPGEAAKAVASLRSTADYAEGIRALRERRVPRWSGA
jgi:methylglutaconyl-CoA hydratase